MAAAYVSSCATDQCEVFLSNVKAQLTCYMEEATTLVRKMEMQEVCGGDQGEIAMIKLRELKIFLELGENLKMDKRSKILSKKCNFYNRGFCSPTNGCHELGAHRCWWREPN